MIQMIHIYSLFAIFFQSQSVLYHIDLFHLTFVKIKLCYAFKVQLLQIHQIQGLQMGYNSQCYSQYCNYNCCGLSGFCVNSHNNCYYYYQDSNHTGVIIGAIVGGVIGIALIIILITCCYRRRQARMQEENINQNRYHTNQNQHSGTNIPLYEYGQNHPNPPHGHSEGYPSGQPMHGNPYPPPQYGQPIGQPAYFGLAPNNNAANYQPGMGQPVYHPQPRNDQFAL